MTKEQYNQRLKELQDEFEAKKKDLVKECALSNNPYKKGDVFTDHIGSIKIEKIGFSYGFGTDIPACNYTGLELKKDGTPTKNEKRRVAHQINDINK